MIPCKGKESLDAQEPSNEGAIALLVSWVAIEVVCCIGIESLSAPVSSNDNSSALLAVWVEVEVVRRKGKEQPSAHEPEHRSDVRRAIVLTVKIQQEITPSMPCPAKEMARGTNN